MKTIEFKTIKLNRKEPELVVSIQSVLKATDLGELQGTCMKTLKAENEAKEGRRD